MSLSILSPEQGSEYTGVHQDSDARPAGMVYELKGL